jgi:HK97 family phage major capsid protein
MLKQLREERAALLAEANAIHEKCKAEQRKMTAEEETKWDSHMDGVDKKSEEIKREERRLKAEELSNEFIEQKAEEKEMSKEEYRDGAGRAIHKLIMIGKAGLTADDYRFLDDNPYVEYRAQTKGTTTEGGFLVPEGFSNKLAEAEAFFGNVESLADVFTTATGNDIPWPKNNDTANVATQVAESGSVATDTDKVFASQTFKAYKWRSGVVKYTAELAQDSFFNIEDLLIENFAWRFARGLNAAYTTGVGTTTIQGCVTGAAAGATAAGASAITVDDLINLIYSVDKAYRRNGTMMMHDSTAKAIRKLTVGTSDARPLWTMGNIQTGEPDSLLGYPVSINNDMAEIGASNKIVLFGDFKNYKVRKVAGDRIIILRELYAENDQVGVLMFKRRDGQVLNAGTNPLKYLTNAAS